MKRFMEIMVPRECALSISAEHTAEVGIDRSKRMTDRGIETIGENLIFLL